MKIVYLIAFILFTIQSAFAQEPSVEDCKRFHTGTFTMAGVSGEPFVFKRTKKFQFEEGLKTKDAKGKFVIEWVDDCTYTLTPARKQDGGGALEGKTLVCKVIRIKGDDQIVRTFVDGIDLGQEYTITKVK